MKLSSTEVDQGEFTIGRVYRSLILPKPLKKRSALRFDRIRIYLLLDYVLCRSKGPTNYLKVFINNKKIENPVEISTIKQMVSTNSAIAVDQGTPTRMTFRDVTKVHVTHTHEATDNNGNNHMTTDNFGSNHVTGKYDKRILGDDKTVSRLPVDDALVQRMCLDIASAVHRQFSEQTMGAAVSGTTASRTAAHRKSEQQQKKQQQQKQHQQEKQEQQQQKHQLQQKKQQQHKEQQKQLQQKKQQQYKEQQQHKEQQQQQHKQQYKEQQQQHKQQPQKRRRHSYQKVSLRPVRYKERMVSAGAVTIKSDDRYNDATVTQEISRTDYPTSVGMADEYVDDNRQDEDADQSPKVWEVNMVDDQVIINSAKSGERRPKAFTATTSAADYDDDNQTS